MRKALPCVLTALAVVVLPQALAAQESKRPGRPGPEMLFQRLDANKDGAISADELPDGVPEPIKQALIRADRNKDKKVTIAEFKEMAKHRQGGPPHGRSPQCPGNPKAGSPQGLTPAILFQRLDADKDGAISAAEVPDGVPEPIKQALIQADRNKDKKVTAEEYREAVKRYHAASSKRRPQGPPHGERAHHGRGQGHYGQRARSHDHQPGPPQAGPRPYRPDPRELFARMDRNKDKQLSLEEFAEGMKRAHQVMAARRPGGPGPPMGYRPGGAGPPSAQRMAMAGRAIFEKADRNEDGKISIDEVPEERREGFKRLLEKADKDGDKALSGEEAKRVAAYIGQRIRAGYGQGHRPGPGMGRPPGRRPESFPKRAEAARRAGEAEKKTEAKKKPKKEKKSKKMKKPKKK